MFVPSLEIRQLEADRDARTWGVPRLDRAVPVFVLKHSDDGRDRLLGFGVCDWEPAEPDASSLDFRLARRHQVLVPVGAAAVFPGVCQEICHALSVDELDDGAVRSAGLAAARANGDAGCSPTPLARLCCAETLRMA